MIKFEIDDCSNIKFMAGNVSLKDVVAAGVKVVIAVAAIVSKETNGKISEREVIKDIINTLDKVDDHIIETRLIDLNKIDEIRKEGKL